MILESSLLLILSYVCFKGLRAGLGKLGLRLGNKALLRQAQVLVFVSLLAPLVLQAIPDRHLPEIRLRVFQATPDREEGFKNLVQPAKAHPVEDIQATAVGAFHRIPSHALLIIWLLGFIACFGQLVFSWIRLARLLLNATPLKRLHSIRVVVSSVISIPFSTRLLASHWVVLPQQMLEHQADFKIAVKHELQHHRQGDTLWAVIIELLRCAFFFNPAIYSWKNTIIELQEFLCDEALSGQKGLSAHDYGSCLVRVAEAALENRNTYVGTTCMAAVSKSPKAFKSFLRRRIEMITQDNRSAKRQIGIAMGTLTLLLTLTAAYAVERTERAQKGQQVMVDAEIQKIADQVLGNAIKKEGARAGFAVVADPATGRILAVANIDSKNKKTGQWALDEKMEPASLMKGIVAAEAIEQGVTTPTAEHRCENGVYKFGDQTFHDWKKDGWEKLTTTEAVAISSDICAMKIAEKLGPDKLRNMFSNYNLGSVESGAQLVPSAAYGMGFKITPIEVIQAYGAIANGGTLLAPQFNAMGKGPKVVRRVLSEENSGKMRQMLQQVVLSGTASRSPSQFYTTAGKTESTSSSGVLDGDSTGGPKRTDIAGFVGFAPVKNPKVEIYVAIFDPNDKTGAHGSTHAVPVFTQLTDQILKHMNIAPDKMK